MKDHARRAIAYIVGTGVSVRGGEVREGLRLTQGIRMVLAEYIESEEL